MENRIGLTLAAAGLLMATTFGVLQAQTTPPMIGTTLSLSSHQVQRGRSVRASVVLEVPSGYHVNAHEPISRFALPTKLEVEAPSGIKVGRIFYPKAIARRFTFSEDRLGVYEHRVAITFTFTVLQTQPPGKVEIKCRLSYQSCSDEVCFPPATRELSVGLMIT